MCSAGGAEEGKSAEMPQSVSEKELAESFSRLSAELGRFALGVARDRHLAEDLVQLAFAKALECREEIRLETIRGWLFTVIYREAVLHKRRQTARTKQTPQLESWWRMRQEQEPDSLVRIENAERLRKALGELPQEQAEIVRRRIDEDQTFAEIARELQLPLGTVLTRMRLALSRLRKAFEDKE